MAKGVRALPSAWSDSSHLQTSADDTIKDRSVFIGPIRRLDLQKQLSMLARWSTLLQIAQHRFADFTKQRQFGFRPRLRVPHVKDLFLPVDVLQTQGDNFAGSQAISGQQHQKGVIPAANRRAVLTSHVQDGLNLLGTQCRRNLLMVIDSWSEHGAAQIESSSTTAVQIAQEASEAHRIALDSLSAQAFGTPLQVRIDIANPKVRQTLLIDTRSQLNQEFQGLCCTSRPCN